MRRQGFCASRDREVMAPGRNMLNWLLDGQGCPPRLISLPQAESEWKGGCRGHYAFLMPGPTVHQYTAE